MAYVEYSDAQKEQARQTDIISFLEQTEGFTFNKKGREYHCIEHDRLVIMKDHMGWYWNSKNIGGSSAVDYCIKIKNMSFPEAIQLIIGEEATYQSKLHTAKPKLVQEPERVFSLPEKT